MELKYFDPAESELKQVDEKTAVSKRLAFFTAQNKEAIEAIERIDQPYRTRSIKLEDIPLGEETTIIVRDPLKLKGTPTKVVLMNNKKHLKIKINEEVTLYFFVYLNAIDDEKCFALELV